MRRLALLLALLILARAQAFSQEVIPRPDEVDKQRRTLTQWKTVAVEEGAAVQVKPLPEVTFTFPEVVKKGALTFRLLFDGPKPMPGYAVGSPPIFIEAAAGFEFKGPVDICVTYAPQLFPDQGVDLRVLRRQDKSWVDETRTLDRDKHVVCAQLEKLGLILLGVRSVPGLYEDLAATVRLIPSEELQQDLADPIVKSREAAQKGDRAAFEEQVKLIRDQLARADPEGLPPHMRDWMIYFLNRLDARVANQTPPVSQ